MRRLLILLAIVALCATGSVSAVAQGSTGIEGGWSIVFRYADGSTYDSVLTVIDVGGDGRVRAAWGKGKDGDPATGTYEDGTLDLTSVFSTEEVTDTIRYTGAVNTSGGKPTWKGDWVDKRHGEFHSKGTFTATLTSPLLRRSPQGGERASATMVMCDRDLLAVTDDARLECTAMVTDASGEPGSTTPGGDVEWTTEVGAISPASCTLASSDSSMTWCAVTLTARAGEIPLGTAPAVTATYGGDATYGPSAGSPQLYGAAGNYEGTDLYGPGCNPAAGPYPAFDCGDPVNPATGNLVMIATDLAVGGRGPGLGIQRTYDSLAAAAGDAGRFGTGWYDLYGARIDIGPGKQRTVVLPGGQTVPFKTAGKRFTAPGWVTATLSKGPKGGLRLRLVDGTGYTFDKAGRMAAMTDTTGEAVTLAYDDDGHVASATDGAGRAITFTSDAAGHVISATDPGGRTVSYGYSPAGDLVSVMDVAGGVTRYGYDERHRLVSVADPMGATATNTYDDRDRLLTQVDPVGGTLSFAYRGVFPDVITMATDGSGIRTGYEFQHGVPIAVTEAIDAVEPSVTRYSYDDQSRPLAVVSADHQLWSSTRDKRGDIVSSTDPLGRTSTMTWDDSHRLLTTISPLGIVTRIERDGPGLPTRLVDAPGTPDEGSMTLTYADPAHPGDLTSVTDQVGATTSFTYDDSGLLASATDGLGGSTSYRYDQVGRLLSMTDPAGATSSVTLDALGNVLTATDALGAITTAAWDARGDLSSFTDALGRVTSLERDVVGRPVGLQLTDGSKLGASWSAVGARTSQTDALGAVTTTTYDDHGRAASWTDANGGVWRTTYDPVGRPLTATDPGFEVTRYAWDAAGELTGVSYSDDTPSVTWTYDADGRRVSMIDATGASTYAWDERSRPVSTTDGAGRTVRYAWDPASRLVALTYPDGSVVERTFDVLGRLIAVRDGAGHQSTFAYDAAGDLVDEQLGNGVTTALRWDAAGRLSSLDSTRDGAALVAFGFERDATGALSSIDHDGTTSAIDRDVVGHLAGVGEESYTFDAAGDLTSLRGAALAYDAGGRLATSSAGSSTTTFGFDTSGRRTSATTGTSTTRYRYDGAGRLVSIDDPASDSSATWRYDGDGMRVGLHDTTAAVDAAFTWGHGSGGSELLDDGSVRYVYGPAGMPLEQIARDGTVTWFHTDQVGSVRTLTDDTGRVVATFDWDAYGLPTAATGTATTRLGFQGSWTDPGTGLQYLQARVYDPVTGQFLTMDPSVTSTHHAYAFAAGDPLAFTDPTGTDPAPHVVMPKGPGKRSVALAGHGEWSATKNGYTIVPEGTSITFYAPAGAAITDELGRKIESGSVTTKWSTVFPAGSKVPNYTLGAPSGLHVLPSSATVTGDMQLSQILKPGMGSVRWAACRYPVDMTPIWGPTEADGSRSSIGITIPGHVHAPNWGVTGPIYEQPRETDTFVDADGMLVDPAWYDWDADQFNGDFGRDV